MPRWRPSFLALGLIGALALVLVLPALAAPPMMHDSFWIDFVWSEQFTAQLRGGVLYPRWLPLSHGGLGAPVFYFYAPLAFYWTGLFGLLGLGTYAAMLAAAGTMWFASGVAMWLWLRASPQDSGARALFGAAVYMAMPYHAFDFYRRGALAEFCAYAILPSLFIAMRRAAAGRGWGALAFAYAALIVAHLPMALLTSVLLVAPWGLWQAWTSPRSAPPLALGLLLGLMLAAIYLVPALDLQRFITVGQLWSVPLFQAQSWNLFAPSPALDPALVRLFAGAMILFGASAALLALRGDRWALWAIAACALIAGAVPALWAVPIMAKVQFPWRALLLVEFAIATAIGRWRSGMILAIVAAVPLLLVTIIVLGAPRPSSEWTPATLAAQRPEVREYLPAGAPDEREIDSPWALALARRQPAVVRDGERTIVARFYFPAWQVRCADGPRPTAPDPRTRLISYRGAGCAVRRVVLPQERVGASLSLAALLLLGCAVLRRRARAGQRDLDRARIVDGSSGVA